jgi:hypothetical protein
MSNIPFKWSIEAQRVINKMVTVLERHEGEGYNSHDKKVTDLLERYKYSNNVRIVGNGTSYKDLKPDAPLPQTAAYQPMREGEYWVLNPILHTQSKRRVSAIIEHVLGSPTGITFYRNRWYTAKYENGIWVMNMDRATKTKPR